MLQIGSIWIGIKDLEGYILSSVHLADYS